MIQFSAARRIFATQPGRAELRLSAGVFKIFDNDVQQS